MRSILAFINGKKLTARSPTSSVMSTDDAIILNQHLAHVEKFKSELSARFKITIDKTLSRYLGIEITRTQHGFLLSQQRLIDSIYEKAKAYIDKYNIASMDVPIKFNRLKISSY